MGKERSLSARQVKFMELYAGNGVEAARLAGYQGNENVLCKTAHDLLRNPRIIAAIQKREKMEMKPLIASRHERQEFWTKVMKDTVEEMRNRLKASELLGKSEADFTEKVDHTFKVTLEDLVTGSSQPKENS